MNEIYNEESFDKVHKERVLIEKELEILENSQSLLVAKIGEFRHALQEVELAYTVQQLRLGYCEDKLERLNKLGSTIEAL
jgi:hypothetical protein